MKFFFYLPMRRIFFFIFLSLYTATIFAEKSDSIKIWGHVCDAFTMHGLIDGVQVELLDQEGRDVTEQYRDEAVEDNWGGGKGTAELFLLYVYMGIVALLGVVFVGYFLRRD